MVRADAEPATRLDKKLDSKLLSLTILKAIKNFQTGDNTSNKAFNFHKMFNNKFDLKNYSLPLPKINLERLKLIFLNSKEDLTS